MTVEPSIALYTAIFKISWKNAMLNTIR
jgi:hypothetical protein